jgi:hypothetical protein
MIQILRLSQLYQCRLQGAPSWVIDWSLEPPALSTTQGESHRVLASRDVFEVYTIVALTTIIDGVAIKPASGSLSIPLMQVK